MNLRIMEFEDKTSAQGKSYTRFKTERGWMSCFEEDVIQGLKQIVGGHADVDVATSDKGFMNIRGFRTANQQVQQVNPQTQATPQPQASPSFSGDKHTTMYVSYAKDIYLALVEKFEKPDAESDPHKVYMAKAINLVKQAREAFS